MRAPEEGSGGDGPVDRHRTSSPCGPACVRARRALLAVRPYALVLRAHAKGRWLGRPLLDVCAREFAGEARRALPALVEELRGGALWLEGREGECRAAGAALRAALIRLDRARAAGPRKGERRHGGEKAEVEKKEREDGEAEKCDGEAEKCDREEEKCDGEAEKCDGEEERRGWEAAVDWLRTGATKAAVEALLARELPALLLLGQRDVLRHRIWRREGRLFADEPLQILRCDVSRLADAEARGEMGKRRRRGAKKEENEGGEALVVVSKPPGPPVHPSGAYHKNSVTSMLNDVLFGGSDAVNYAYSEHYQRPGDEVPRYVSICHRTEGFELIRVWIASPKHQEEDRETTKEDRPPFAPPPAMGVCWEDWELLKRGLDGGRGREPPWRAFVVHRLDAATSGVLIFALDAASARAVATLIAQKEPTDNSDADKKGNKNSTHNNNNNNKSCVKLYLALVEGKFDAEALVQGGAYHCSLLEDPWKPLSSSTTAASEVIDDDSMCRVEKCARKESGGRGESGTGSRWLRVERAIGCLDPHQSLYWCAGEKRTARWRLQKHRFNEIIKATTTTTGQDQQQGRRKATMAALNAKHERMRLLTTGKGHFLKAEAQEGEEDAGEFSGQSHPHKDVTKLENYEQTLREAITCFRAAHYNPIRDQTLVECALFTGRTHQVRVHLASLGHPIVDDEQYARLQRRLRSLPDANTSPSEEKEEKNKGKEEEDVDLYYRYLINDWTEETGLCSLEGVEIDEEKGDVGGRLCICPRRICLHAWRYILRHNTHENKETVLESPPPLWAVVE